ncbi:MAG TPA: APC family permease [Bryobacteraceae bacterium]|nr:APC family permease [Bryobacteraceae bacterium]
MPDSELRRELGLRDITLFAISCIVGTRWIPAAAHAGPGSLTLWILGAAFFVVPLAVSVGALIGKYPGAGGLYVWTRADFGPVHGFLGFWLYWLGIAFWFPSAAIFYCSAAFHMLGFAEDRILLLAVSLAAIWIALGANLIGMKIGKWEENLGAACSWILCALLVGIALLIYARRGSATPMHIAPRWDWDTVNFWSTIAYAMSGLELAGMMGGEIREPKRTLPRAGWIASAFITTYYIACTASMLVIAPPQRISELNGFAEIAESSGAALHSPWLSPVIALLVLVSAIGQFGGMGTAVSRLPFAAGIDGLLPRAFARVHPAWGTPHVSIIVFGAVSSFLLLALQLGDTMRAAYQALVSLMVLTGFIPFLYIFGSAWKAGKRISALSGGAITALAIVCSVAPTSETSNVWLFELKIALGTLGAVLSGWLLYRRAASPKPSPQRT